jgi:hypothetical protein
MTISRALWLIAILFVTSCRQVAPLPESALRDLASIDQFRAAFNADVAQPRLVVIVSPT